jgi:hypothetical protein
MENYNDGLVEDADLKPSKLRARRSKRRTAVIDKHA